MKYHRPVFLRVPALLGVRLFALVAASVWAGCSGDGDPTEPLLDAGPRRDAGRLDGGDERVDAARDAAPRDVGLGHDVEPPPPAVDAAQPDAGSADAGAGDAGLGDGADAGRRDAGRADAGPTADFRSCEVASDCRLVVNSCCGRCGQPELEDLSAVNEASVAAHRELVCPGPGPTPCPECVRVSNPWLFATCRAGRCEAIDLRATDVSSPCSSSSECSLRTPTCCDCGPRGESPIGIRRDREGALRELICDPAQVCPADCAPSFPEGSVPWCRDGICDAAIP